MTLIAATLLSSQAFAGARHNLSNVVHGQTATGSRTIIEAPIVTVNLATSHVTLTFPATNSSEGSPIQNYRQTYDCSNDQSDTCTLVDDELGYGKSISVLSDGSIIYRNVDGVSCAFVQR